MDLDKFLKDLGVALRDTSLVEDAFTYLCYIPAAQAVAIEVLLSKVSTFSERDQNRFDKIIKRIIKYRYPMQPIITDIDRTSAFREKTIIEKCHAYICRSRAGNLLAREVLRDTPLAQPKENPGIVMTEWLLSATTFVERQVLLLSRFPAASDGSVAEDLGFDKEDIRILHDRAKAKINARKNEITWESIKPENTFTGKVPGWEKFQVIYEASWSRSVEEFAYHLIGDQSAPHRVIADQVKALSQPHIEDGTFDITQAWEGNETGWPGFKALTFTATKAFLKDFNQVDKHCAKSKPKDVWASRIKERLSVSETQCLLLSTLFFPRDPDGIRSISELINVDTQSVEEHIKNAVRKMLDSDWSEIKW